MKSLSCKDMGSTMCDFVATGATDEEVIQKIMAHVKTDHPEELKKMEAMSHNDMITMMKSKIKEA